MVFARDVAAVCCSHYLAEFVKAILNKLPEVVAEDLSEVAAEVLTGDLGHSEVMTGELGHSEV